MAWAKEGSDTLTSAGDTITLSSLTDVDFHVILANSIPSGLARHAIRLNSDTGTNYAWRQSNNGAADGTEVSNSRMVIQGDNTATVEFSVSYMINIPAEEKLLINFDIKGMTAGAANAPTRQETVSKWANTSNAVDEIILYNSESGDYDTDSNLSAFGTD